MTSDLSEVYDYVIIPDGQRLYKPELCPSCNFIKGRYIFYTKCCICNHLYIINNNTQDSKLEGCWCKSFIKNGYIKKEEEYPEFWKKCLLNSLPHFERIGITCNSCKHKEGCEDGGVNIGEVIQYKGCCEDYE